MKTKVPGPIPSAGPVSVDKGLGGAVGPAKRQPSPVRQQPGAGFGASRQTFLPRAWEGKTWIHECVGGLLRYPCLDADLRGISASPAADEETMETERPGTEGAEVVPDETGTPPEVPPMEPTGEGDEGDDTAPH